MKFDRKKRIRLSPFKKGTLDTVLASCIYVSSIGTPAIDQSRGSPPCHGGSPAADHQGVEQCEITKFTKIGAGSVR